jgi:ABC-type transporter Mla subunit MlaD
MGLYGDPAALDALADRLAFFAGQLREHAADHVRAAAAANWVSAAADEFRERVAQETKKVDDAADTLDRAAAKLRAHAETVRGLIAEIASIEHAATNWLSEQAHGIEHAVGGLVRHLPWPDLGGPLGLPASGDKAWLEVGSLLRERGGELV